MFFLFIVMAAYFTSSEIHSSLIHLSCCYTIICFSLSLGTTLLEKEKPVLQSAHSMICSEAKINMFAVIVHFSRS